MRFLRWCVLFAVLLGTSCTDAERINAQFASSEVTWYRFSSLGAEKVNSPSEAWNGNWESYQKAVRTTDLLFDGKVFAAVAGLGLVEIDDAEGTPKEKTISSPVDLKDVRTGRVFPFQHKIFLSLYREPESGGLSVVGPPLTLAWFQPDTSGLEFYPVPFQAENPRRQAVFSTWDADSGSVHFVWKSWGDGWVWETSRLRLADGAETDVSKGWIQPNRRPLDASWRALWSRLAARSGEKLDPLAEIREPGKTTASFRWSSQPGAVRTSAVSGVRVSATELADHGGKIAVSENGFVAYEKEGSETVRLFRLFDLGAAGRYTAVVSARHGVVLAWETFWRSYSGPSGLVYIPLSRFSD